MSDVRIEVVGEVTDELVDAFERLIPQVSSSPPPSREDLEEIVASESSTILLARNGDGAILGSLTLVVFLIPTGRRAWIEAVVTDEAARGRGVGSALNLAALDLAREEGCTTVNLTSRPSREAANRLYQRLGFEQRETNVYVYRLDG